MQIPKPHTQHKRLLLNKKTKTYVLLGAVLVIWGVIGYRILATIHPDIPEVKQNNVTVNFNPKNQTKVDTFSINATTRDPFLGTLATKKKTVVKKNIPKKPKQELPNAPLITYGGLLKKQQSTQQVFVVNINNNQYLLKKGQERDSVKLIKGDAKAIVIRFRGKTKTIAIQ